jgi:DNA-binding transcriptional ArsR family regulator
MNVAPIRPGVPAIAAAIGEPARARMLLCLMDGRARTSTELAIIAQVSAPTASVHLAKLRAAKLVRTLPQGRNRYYSLQGEEVAAALEALSVLAGAARADSAARVPVHLRLARTCYDHVAGALGVSWHDRLRLLEWLTLDERTGSYELTARGASGLAALGVDVGAVRAQRRRFACACRDWSERRSHLGGALGAALLQLALKHRWVQRHLDSRALSITRVGRRELQTRFGLEA